MNWAAILLAGIADWLFGAVWFKALSKEWVAGLNMSPEDKRVYLSTPNFWPYIIALLCSILIAYAIAQVVAGSATHSLFRGIGVGVLVGLAAALAMITNMVFEARIASFILISAAYPLLGCILMGIIIGVWKPKRTSDLGGKASL
ncbi:MAG: DUF1761 domain-containing protein [Candidatus Korobacteraceae bacterium]